MIDIIYNQSTGVLNIADKFKASISWYFVVN